MIASLGHRSSNSVQRTAPTIGIACSGLGHVRRGNETWAWAVAEELRRFHTKVTLFGGGPLQTACEYRQVRNVPRETFLWRNVMSWGRRYFWEQVSFGFFLERHLRRMELDLVQIADPILALRMHRRTGKHGVPVVYKDGLLLGPSWCQKFDYVQVLAPYYREVAEEQGVDTSRWFVIPHLVDASKFAPAADRTAVRAKVLGESIPADAYVILAVGDLSPESNKRLDWVLQETAKLPAERGAYLVLAGASTSSQADVMRVRVRGVLGDRGQVLTNLTGEQMVGLYQCADVFAHAALREPFGIVFLEAMASGLPVVAHPFEVTRWIIGSGGITVDMTEMGRLAEVLEAWGADPEQRRAYGEHARLRAATEFAPERIIPCYQQMYQTIQGG
jgi:1,2-diacylglycerol 3-alpha-glucosyltransferase